MFKVNNKNTRTRCEICSKLTIKTPERRQITNFEQVNTGWVVIGDRGIIKRKSNRRLAEIYLLLVIEIINSIKKPTIRRFLNAGILIFLLVLLLFSHEVYTCYGLNE